METRLHAGEEPDAAGIDRGAGLALGHHRTTASPGLFETMEVLGRDRVLSRMERALAL
ncbi:hypothetical protein [Desulfolutivibrio sulfoxidireducens]|uniref:hypothetical protein n=1 Tax=Desulfolutivibrio sulfoxidireducens TaxID=2773299 RepID=UPI00159D1102|nr:hypothetical protein [Desulfolutivibrio sulfoxidireducens]